MFDFILQWSLHMANTIKSAARKRRSENPRIQLIPVFDETFNGDKLRNEIRDLLASMFMNAHKRGRPKKDCEPEVSNAA